jgi:hypothetical protein
MYLDLLVLWLNGSGIVGVCIAGFFASIKVIPASIKDIPQYIP